jgi:hypothetical protein
MKSPDYPERAIRQFDENVRAKPVKKNILLAKWRDAPNG